MRGCTTQPPQHHPIQPTARPTLHRPPAPRSFVTMNADGAAEAMNNLNNREFQVRRMCQASRPRTLQAGRPPALRATPPLLVVERP